MPVGEKTDSIPFLFTAFYPYSWEFYYLQVSDNFRAAPKPGRDKSQAESTAGRGFEPGKLTGTAQLKIAP
jgi:hypothetical protein